MTSTENLVKLHQYYESRYRKAINIGVQEKYLQLFHEIERRFNATQKALEYSQFISDQADKPTTEIMKLMVKHLAIIRDMLEVDNTITVKPRTPKEHEIAKAYLDTTKSIMNNSIFTHKDDLPMKLRESVDSIVVYMLLAREIVVPIHKS